MLKIKNDVDLDILEKYGFKYDNRFYNLIIWCDKGYFKIIINKKTRKIKISYEYGCYISHDYIEANSEDGDSADFSISDEINLDIIYDLIADGLVEKC